MTNCGAPSGFAVVFAEDVPNVPTTDVTSGESVLLDRRAVHSCLSYKLPGENCALNMRNL